METIKKSILLEDNKQRNEIRTIVRDIVQVFKDNDDGEFYLPEDLDDEKVEGQLESFQSFINKRKK